MLIAWLLMIIALVFMVGWARWLLHRAEGRAMLPQHNPMLLTLTTIGLSAGTLSLVMLIIGMMGLPLDWRIAAGVCAIIGAIGFILRDKPYLLHENLDTPLPPQPLTTAHRIAWVVVTVLCGLILFNAVYWPFGVDDAVTLYATFGKNIALSGQLPVGNLYETYPMLIPLNYAFVFQASGWINEYLAALIPALLSIGVVGAAYQLGRELFNRSTGLIAAVLIVLAPMITHWASAGYVDLPCAFYYGMTLVFLVRLERTRSWADALLAGTMAGLAAWAKNSGLLIVPMIGLWIVYRYWVGRRAGSSTDSRFPKWQHVGLTAVAFTAVAGLWYARNLVLTGMIIPPTGWTWKAERSFANLFPYALNTHYGVIGLVFTVGLLFTIGWVLRGFARNKVLAFLLIFTLPFFAIWWALFSYEDRFLLVLTAPIAVMSANLIQEIWRRVPARNRFPLISAATVIVVLLALPAASAAVDFKFYILRQPLMSDIEKHELRLGKDRYQAALFLRTLPSGSKIWTQDLLLPFHADGMQMTVGAWPTGPEQLANFDYWVLSPRELLPNWFGVIEPIHSEGGYRVYHLPKSS